MMKFRESERLMFELRKRKQDLKVLKPFFRLFLEYVKNLSFLLLISLS